MIETLHHKRCLEVLHCNSVKDFKRQIVEFSQRLGFETVGAMVVTQHSPTMTEFQTVTNAPAAYLDEFHDPGHAALDPVSQHCSTSSVPIVWDRRNYASPGMRMLWEAQEPFGYRSGLAWAMHLGRGRHFMFGANWSKDRCSQVRNFTMIAEDLMSFGLHAQAAAFELSLPTRCEPDAPWSLANIELEALRWTMDGMTSWDVGERMSISAAHVTLLLRRAMQKLGCSTKYETCIRAIRLGLIECE
jgi:DNA-binding CsgD family transcriptional regulator